MQNTDKTILILIHLMLIKSQETIQEDAANPVETTTVEMEKLEDLEPNDISLEENNQAL